MAIYLAITALVSAIVTWILARNKTAAHIYTLKNQEIKGLTDAAQDQIAALNKEIEELKGKIEELSSEGSRKKVAGEYLIDALSGLKRIEQIKDEIISYQQSAPNIPAAAPKVVNAEGASLEETKNAPSGEAPSQEKKVANS